LCVEAVLWIARTGAPWRDLLQEFGKRFTVYTRFWRRAQKNVWERVFKILSDDPDFERLRSVRPFDRCWSHDWRYRLSGLTIGGTVSGSGLTIGGTVSGSGLKIGGTVSGSGLMIGGTVSGSDLMIGSTVSGSAFCSRRSIAAATLLLRHAPDAAPAGMVIGRRGQREAAETYIFPSGQLLLDRISAGRIASAAISRPSITA
jgi:transposase